MDHIPDHRLAWYELLTANSPAEPYGVRGLQDLEEEELVHARAYIGRELSERELQRREQEEQEQPESTA